MSELSKQEVLQILLCHPVLGPKIYLYVVARMLKVSCSRSCMQQQEQTSQNHVVINFELNTGLDNKYPAKSDNRPPGKCFKIPNKRPVSKEVKSVVCTINHIYFLDLLYASMSHNGTRLNFYTCGRDDWK